MLSETKRSTIIAFTFRNVNFCIISNTKTGIFKNKSHFVLYDIFHGFLREHQSKMWSTLSYTYTDTLSPTILLSLTAWFNIPEYNTFHPQISFHVDVLKLSLFAVSEGIGNYIFKLCYYAQYKKCFFVKILCRQRITQIILS